MEIDDKEAEKICQENLKVRREKPRENDGEFRNSDRECFYIDRRRDKNIE
jgi:hypothetical protein